MKLFSRLPNAFVAFAVLFLGLSASLPAAAAAAGAGAGARGCLDATEVSAIKAAVDFHEIDTTLKAVCDPDSQAYKILDALITIKQTRFPSLRPLTNVDQNFFVDDFWSYFTSRIKTVQNESAEGCEGRMAFAITALQLHTIFVCPLFYQDHTSKAERMAVLLHEPRHDEAEGFSHVQCTQAYTMLAGKACDGSFREKGAWAVTIEALHLILNYAHLTAVDINLVKFKMLEIGSVFLNQPIFSLEKNAALYLKSKDGKSAFVYSDAGLFSAPLITAGAPISRRFSVSVFPTDKSDSFTAGLFTPALQVMPPLGASSVAYNEEPIRERDPIVDILNDDDEMIAVSAHTVDILGVPKITVNFEITGIISSTEAGETPTQNFYLSDRAGKFHKVLRGRGGNASILDSENPIRGFTQVIQYEGQRLGLLPTGSVMLSTPAGWIPFAPLANNQFSFISRPFLWSDSLGR